MAAIPAGFMMRPVFETVEAVGANMPEPPQDFANPDHAREVEAITALVSTFLNEKEKFEREAMSW